MTNMGETMSKVQGAAERVITGIGALIQSDLKEDIEVLKSAVSGTGDTDLNDSMVVLGQLVTAYEGVLELVLPSILAAERAQHHAIHWKG